jgi:hypothetical protein
MWGNSSYRDEKIKAFAFQSEGFYRRIGFVSRK